MLGPMKRIQRKVFELNLSFSPASPLGSRRIFKGEDRTLRTCYWSYVFRPQDSSSSHLISLLLEPLPFSFLLKAERIVSMKTLNFQWSKCWPFYCLQLEPEILLCSQSCCLWAMCSLNSKCPSVWLFIGRVSWDPLYFIHPSGRFL